tara:strand:- start:497 stop:952 length:456 start_codon:yes stop_codon:yes gene_type:complete
MQMTTVSRSEAEKVYIVVRENNAEEILAGEVAEWVATTTDANRGLLVQVVDTAINATTGIAARVAGVAETTIGTDATGRLQVYGPANVRSSASYAAGRLMVAGSINATNIGHVTTAIQTTTTAPEYHGAIVGWTLENGPNATNASVHLEIL